jgi:hypothetical protein
MEHPVTALDAYGNARFCGCPDNAINEAQAWPDAFVTLAVLGDSETDKVGLSEQRTDLESALIAWSGPTERLTFRLEPAGSGSESATDITLSYREGAHGDGQPFDGLGTVVGHAWPPPDGRIHHDNAEVWTPLMRKLVTRHESGHALGLPHSPDLGNVMYPYVSGDGELGPWDIAQIQARYGQPQSPTAPGPTIPPPPLLWGVRRDVITLDGEPTAPELMIKMYAHDGDTSDRIAESAYFEGDFWILQIPECRRFSVQMTSPVETEFLGPWEWRSGVLLWTPALPFVTRGADGPSGPAGPDAPTWLPWRTAEINLGQITMKDVEIRFLDTRPPEEDPGDALARRSYEHLQFHGDGGERETHRRLTDRRS